MFCKHKKKTKVIRFLSEKSYIADFNCAMHKKTKVVSFLSEKKLYCVISTVE